MKKSVFHELEKKVLQIEKEYSSLENFVINSTIPNEEHTMRMEEAISSTICQLQQVYQELYDLELADLVDYQNFVGRFDGKFS